MAGRFVGTLLGNIYVGLSNAIGHNVHTPFQQVCRFACRQSTRERKAKQCKEMKAKKLRRLAKLPPYVPKILREKRLQEKARLMLTMREDNEKKPLPRDNVYMCSQFRWPLYSFAEAIECFRETHHPTMFNIPDARVNALIEVDMSTEKVGKPLTKFAGFASLVHEANLHPPRQILALSKNLDWHDIAKKAGAAAAGGRDIIKQMQSEGFDIQNYDFCIAHPDILADLIVVKGIMKKKFPTLRDGTLGTDFAGMIRKFLHGVNYSTSVHALQKDYGIIDIAFGRLNQDTKQLEENFASLLQSIHSNKPKSSEVFLTRTRLTCQPSPDKLLVDYRLYIPELNQEEEKDELEVSDVVIATH